jgi:ribosomal protein S9
MRGGPRDDPAGVRAERDDAIREILELERESNELDARIAAGGGLDAQLEAAIAARAAAVVAAGGPNAPRLAEAVAQLDGARAAARHLGGAAEIARDATAALDQAIAALVEVRDRGAWDRYPDDRAEAERRQQMLERARIPAGKARGRLTLLSETLREAGASLGAGDVRMAEWIASATRAMEQVPQRGWELAGRVDQDLEGLRRTRERAGRLHTELRGHLAGWRERVQELERERRELLSVPPPI